MNQYTLMQQRHQQEISNFPIAYAFGQQQFEKAMCKLGLDSSETDKVCSIFGAGDICRKDDAPKFIALLRRHKQERRQAIAADKTGDGFIYQMIDTELANHEYCVTGSFEETLDALGMTMEQVNADPRFVHAFARASKEQREYFNEMMKKD